MRLFIIQKERKITESRDFYRLIPKNKTCFTYELWRHYVDLSCDVLFSFGIRFELIRRIIIHFFFNWILFSSLQKSNFIVLFKPKTSAPFSLFVFFCLILLKDSLKVKRRGIASKFEMWITECDDWIMNR